MRVRKSLILGDEQTPIPGPGTDHGTAAPVFLIGRPIQGDLHGRYPTLAQLKDDDPEHAIDFRRVYATVLERWLKLPAEASLGAPFEPLPLFRS